MSERTSRKAAVQPSPPPSPPTRLGDDDLYLLNEGSHLRLYDKLGAHLAADGAQFGVWAPNAASVSVVGDFNGWDRHAHPLAPRAASGVWEGFIPGVNKGDTYKYHIVSNVGGYEVDKADPLAFYAQTPPDTASRVWDFAHEWGDAEWMANRGERNSLHAPMAIYEMHIGSWRRNEDGTPMSYRDLAVHLVEYLVATNFTHVEFMPIVEHPFGGSWGYQATGFYAPTSRFGTPDDVMYLIDQLHQAGIGVILDWVPSHFPTDEHGLMFFDGTHLYEHADPRQGIHPDWDSAIFNYGREQVRSFLLSSAMFWLDRYHIDGLRVDAVASMLYLDYSRKPGAWSPNKYGGHENIEAIEFLRRFNSEVYSAFPDVQTIAEESTAWPMVSRPTYLGGLGFGLKWDMGWMHDTLRYMSKDPVHRPYHHTDLSFRGMYAFAENYCLPLSHDEVVHLKGSLLTKMPGDDWQRRANLRLLFAYMYTTPGKKLLFMGGEIGQWREWDHDGQLQWELLDDPAHRGLHHLVSELGRVYRDEPALHELDNDPAGWQWIDASDAVQSTLSYLRAGRSNDDVIAVVCNFTAIPRMNHRIGGPRAGFWREILNSDADAYGGSGHGNYGGVEATPVPFHGRPYSVVLTLPPLAAVILKSDGGQQL